jgi:large subunit ribosomal protein L30
MGMIQKSKDFITWGEIDEKTFSALVGKWGRKAGGKRLEKSEAKEFAAKFMTGKTTFKEAGIKPYFKLHAPSKGYERVGIKKHVNVGGALGYRGKGINTLLTKMAGIKDGTKKQKDTQ